MTNKLKKQTDCNLQENQNRKSFPIPGMIDFRGLKAAFVALNSYEPDPLFINGQYLYL